MKVIYSLEDDSDIARIINVSLTKAGYQVASYSTCKEFIKAFEIKKPDLIILDLMLPDGSGMDVLKKIRSDFDNRNVRAVILSAKRMTIDKVEGLDNGADDYIEKPFDVLELISRINARFRETSQVMSYGRLSLNLDKHTAYFDDKELNVTMLEFDILTLFLNNVGKVVTREQIYDYAYKSSNELESRSIDVHIASLRRKISQKDFIRTVYGVGYMIG